MTKSKYTLFSIIISMLFGIFFYFNNYIKINKLKKEGSLARIREVVIYNGDNENNYYYNYYFVTDDSLKVNITHNINRKSIATDRKHYHHKQVIYLKNNPTSFIVEDKINSYDLKYYFFGIPFLIFILLWVLQYPILKMIK